MKKKFITSIISGIIAACVAIPVVTHATTSLRDPNGDGWITAADSTFINLFLGGTMTPSNLTPLDFDQNGIVSAMDSFKVQVYNSGITNIVPDASANDPTITPATETLTYRKYAFNSSTYDTYDLYPNTFSVNSIDETDLLFTDDDTTSVVRLTTQGSGGSGFIVGNHVVATSAHSVLDSSGDVDTHVNVTIIGEDGEILANYVPDYIHIPNKFFTPSVSNYYDYALLYIGDGDLNQYGVMKLGYCLDSYINDGGAVRVMGFPKIGNNWGNRYYSFGTLSSSNNMFQMLYSAQTAERMSGGPVYVEETFIRYQYNIVEKKKTVIGIHSNESGSSGCGVRINSQHLKFYYDNSNLT